jgi:hypothetical protein
VSAFDYGALANASSKRVARASFLVLDQLQQFAAHEQPLAAAAVFLLICEKHGVPVQEVFVAIKNLLNDERHGGQEQFRAIRAYIENELK